MYMYLVPLKSVDRYLFIHIHVYNYVCLIFEKSKYVLFVPQ